LNYLRNYTVLMYEFELEEIEKERGAEAGMNLKFNALQVVEPEIERHEGIQLEDSLWIFENSCDALKAAMSMQKALINYNRHQTDKFDEIHVTGYGLHHGQMLFIEGTDIHWGDPVNTSSKLG
jgi:class 3 adenylate cyclase